MTPLRLTGIRACVFDAYGTLFDVNSAAAQAKDAVAESGIADLIDAVLSVEDVKMYKPHPSVYRLAIERLGLERGQICFLSSNAWDAYAAKAFGLHVLWCNRFGQAPERIPERPDGEISTLATLPEIVGA
ncbi:MAG: hypothetical protein A3G24_11685 [Betaproteobacteria bacterium RIFCSPLOWO2_12_FULL_62_13]|nr:MAG: hypothetical protein A3G24_11685 [Betaproteobacteria bacterium RIFCSPLOWO2_12_FULL_62_13]